MKILVGYTGFVGSNIASKSSFDLLCNSQNIEEAYGTNPDLLIYAGVPAEKYMANKFPEKDMEVVNIAIENIKKINPSRLVLISTIDVYDVKSDVDESSLMNDNHPEAYGRNRLYLETWVENNFENYLIVRLPGLFGKGIKKNFIYDLINLIPQKLTSTKINELKVMNSDILNYYSDDGNGFFSLKETDSFSKEELKKLFINLNFSALNFTDSEGVFQYYDLSLLANHIDILLDNNIKKCNLFTEPFSIKELYKYIKNEDFNNKISDNPPVYNIKTKFDYLFDRNDGYVLGKEEVLKRIKLFVESYK